MRLSPEEKATIAKYASDHGVSKALKHFKEKQLKESSVRDWLKLYRLELQRKSKAKVPDQQMSVKCLPSKTLGRPPILGFKLDHLLQEKIKSMRLRGTPIGTSVVISIGTAIAKKHSYSCEAPTLGKEWAKSVLRRMGFSKRRANSKSKVIF